MYITWNFSERNHISLLTKRQEREKKKKKPLYLSILNLEEVPKFFPIAHLTTLLVSKEVVINNQYTYIYIKGEISFESVWDFVKWCSPWGFSCNKRYGLFFSLIHRFKTIHLSLTKIITIWLQNKHQLKDNDSLFS